MSTDLKTFNSSFYNMTKISEEKGRGHQLEHSTHDNMKKGSIRIGLAATRGSFDHRG